MNPTSSPASATTRRDLLRTGAFGAAATAFLAACGTKADRTAGQSGDDPVTTTPDQAPEAPLPEVSEADLAYDQDLLMTATSLELLAVELYNRVDASKASKDELWTFEDEAWKTEFARFSVDHAAAAEVFQEETDPEYRVTKPNEWLIEQSIGPVAEDLKTASSAAVLDFFAGLESTLAATYITAVSSFSQVEGRAMFAGYAEAAARRNALMGNGGQGAPPESALFPLQDLIPNEAYLTVTQADAGVAEDSKDEGES